MPKGPSRFAEKIVGALLPGDRREEVLGDLHERYSSPRQYVLDVVRTVPLVVLSHTKRSLMKGSMRMNPKVLLAIVGAFLIGLAVGGRLTASNIAPILISSSPFLLLLAFWLVAIIWLAIMGRKVTRRH